MSSRNAWDQKSSARDRLKAEREKEAKRAKARRQIFAVVGVVVVIGVVAGIAIGVTKATHKGPSKPLVVPANASGTNGTTVIYGSASAKHTLHLYEDPRCPICASFEQTDGAQIVKGADAGDYKIQYTFGTFLDGNLGGSGSMNALSALGAALDVSPKAFIEFHTALYSKANHPDEQTDKFKDDSYLFKISNEVPALKDNAAFQKNVKDGKYDSWASKMSASFTSSGVQGTPTAMVDGKKFAVTGFNNPPEGVIPLAQFTPALDKAIGK
ncbi:thioredoxin domain-containing protein [Streptomyces sp. SL13]|jgi:protein-disulfide isomerase|uniref:Thioredoxin domain-containing protein n=1 Tax=Streptantibioticus silvisoli TaxID=2705255 RepID=A0AA90GZ44_9ACTN|nr:thioredoxin domain-containing protein [Streptantibioticus silvisoli]MDI5963603.1 thioredoxin domain-containing protein [Streptantibioticus silvisoli]MDI5970269.1 thioredoxin domain-containing protein [Streptantibioticus silvisoli]